jgi:hypothetical protein
MNPAIYHVLHILGILMLFMGYGALIANSLSGANAKNVRILAASTSGIGLLLMLVAGFGLIARLYGNEFEIWMWAKFGVWLLFGVLIVAIKRQPKLGYFYWLLSLLLGLLSAWMVYFKPFL